MKSKISSLTQIQRDILKSIIFVQPKRPYNFSFGKLYGDMDIKKYSEDNILNALTDLVNSDLLNQENDDSYIFS